LVKKNSPEPISEVNYPQQVHLNEEDYRSLFHFASDAIWIHDLEGHIVAVNEAFEQLLGQPGAELIGRNVREFLSGDGLSVAAIVKKKLLKGERAVGRYEQLVLRDDGRQVILEITTCLIRRRGKPLAFENIARDVTEKREIEKNLKFCLHKVLQAQEDERKRISRDLHDEAIQSLLLIVHELDAFGSQLGEHPPARSRAELRSLRKLVVEVEESLRRVLQDLRPAILDDLGLPASLEWIADRITREGKMVVQVVLDKKPHELSSEIELTLFRIAQEALSNIRKHSQASKVLVKLNFLDDSIRLTVADNGVGFTVPALGDVNGNRGLGLLSMQERAQILQGNVKIRSIPRSGTTVIAEIPYNLVASQPFWSLTRPEIRVGNRSGLCEQPADDIKEVL